MTITIITTTTSSTTTIAIMVFLTIIFCNYYFCLRLRLQSVSVPFTVGPLLKEVTLTII